MALFKIFKGQSADFDETKVPLHDGYAYFTPDNGFFYIDAVVNGTLQRVKLAGSVTSVNDITPDALGNVGLTSLDIDDFWRNDKLYDLHTILNENLDTYMYDNVWNTDEDTVEVSTNTLVLDDAHNYDDLPDETLLADGILNNFASKEYVDKHIQNYSYHDIKDKPAINGIVLEGDRSLYALGIQPRLTNENFKTINGMSLLAPGNLEFEGTLNYLFLHNLPSINNIELTGNKTLAELGIHNFSGRYNDLTGKPKLKKVATTGSYLDLLNKPVVTDTYNPGSTNGISGKGVAAALETLNAEGMSGIRPNQTIASWYELNGKVSLGIQDIAITTSQITNFPNYAGSATKGGSATSAEKVNHGLNITVGYNPQGTFDGSEDVSIEVNATTLGLGTALHFVGTTDTIPTSQTIIMTDGSTYEAHSGDVVVCMENGLQYMSNGSTWTSFGDATSYALEDHVHGFISNQGIITNQSYQAVNNVLLRSDGTGHIVAGETIARNGDNSLFLRNDGTWAHPLDLSVVDGKVCITYTTE